jgi:hypothetical protein
MFCSKCGEEILNDWGAEHCPKCDVQLSGNEPEVQLKRKRFTAKIILTMFAVLVVAMIALAYSQRNAFKIKAYDAAACSDIKSAQYFCEEYFAEHAKYLENPKEFGEGMTGKLSNGVKIEYVPGKDRYSYVITSYHPEGENIYKVVSNKPGMLLYRLKKEPEDAYRPKL